MAGNENSGNRSKEEKRRSVQTILDGTAKEAAILLDKYIRKIRGFTKMSPEKLKACQFVVDHAVGKPRQKIEHSGGILTYAQLAKSADDLDKKPRPILADVKDVADNYREPVTPGPTSDQDNPTKEQESQ